MVDQHYGNAYRYDYLDSYFMYHYQTALIYNESPEYDLSEVSLDVSSPSEVNVYDSVTGKLVKLDEEKQDFTNGSITYTVAASGNQGNYTVCVVKNTFDGADLFVNGPDEREIFFDDYYGEYHDILVANLGNEELTGLSVELTDAQNVKLDGYWTLGGEKNDVLAPFTKARDYNELDMPNLAKIRLIPDGEGTVAGKLTISADGQEPVTIELKGYAGNPDIVTNPILEDAVKYVPYYAVVATNNIHEWNRVSFSLYSGSLPKGVTFNNQTGEIYGVPQQTGIYNFTIMASFSESSFSNVYKTFTLEVVDNTNINVFNATDEDYDLLTAIGYEQTSGAYDFQLSSTDIDQLFVSNGTYDEFVALWINGEKMTPDEDFTSEQGSTRITIRHQTLQNKLIPNIANTIAAEFRVAETNEVKKTAQNVIVSINKPGNNGNGNNGNNGTASTPVYSNNQPQIIDTDISGWDAIKTKLNGMSLGLVEIDMGNSTTLPSDITAVIKGKSITLRLKTTNCTFEVNGKTVNDVKDSDVGVKLNISTVSSSALDKIKGALSRTAFSVDNNGAFGYTAGISNNFGTGFADKIANVYKVNGSDVKCVSASKISDNGTAVLNIKEGGNYIIAIDNISRLPGDVNNDLVVNNYDASVILRYSVGLTDIKEELIGYYDLNNDGKLNVLDASIILRYSVGLIASL